MWDANTLHSENTVARSALKVRDMQQKDGTVHEHNQYASLAEKYSLNTL